VQAAHRAGVHAIKIAYSDSTHTGRPPVIVMSGDIMTAIIDESHTRSGRMDPQAHDFVSREIEVFDIIQSWLSEHTFAVR
jgi:hypothetical protein